MSCSISMVAYIGRRENVSILKVSYGSYVKMLHESSGTLHLVFVALTRSLSNFLTSRTRKGVV